ncbi:hypothetical protein D3C85_1083950 [compost metagenome]
MKASRYISLLLWILVANGLMWAGGTTDWLCREKSHYDPLNEGLSFEGKYCDDGEFFISNTLSAELVVKGLRLMIPDRSDLAPGVFFPYVWIGLYLALVAGAMVFRRRLHDGLVFVLQYVHRKL